MPKDHQNKSVLKESIRLRIFLPTVTSLLLGSQFGCNNLDAKKFMHKNNLRGSGGEGSCSSTSIPYLNATIIERNNQFPLHPEPVSTILPVVGFSPYIQANPEDGVPTSLAPVLAEGEWQFAFSRAYNPFIPPPLPQSLPSKAPSFLRSSPEENYYELPVRSLQLASNQNSEAHVYPETESLYDEIPEDKGKKNKGNMLKRVVKWSNTVFTTNKTKK